MPGLHVTSFGSIHSPRVVCLHGFLGAGADWQPLAQRLQERYRVDLIDLPGHGQSVGLAESAYQWAGALTLIGELSRDAAALVGYSMGGRLALATALAGPGQARAVVIVSASAGLEQISDRLKRQREDEQRAETLVRDGLPTFLAHWYEQPLFASLQKQPALRQELIQRRCSGSAHEMARALRGLSVSRQPSLWGELPSLQAPALYVAGAEDAPYAAMAERAAGLSPLGSAFMVPHSGHMPHLEQPGRCLDGIVSFLQQHVE